VKDGSAASCSLPGPPSAPSAVSPSDCCWSVLLDGAESLPAAAAIEAAGDGQLALGQTHVHVFLLRSESPSWRLSALFVSGAVTTLRC
jgi:hypothetical protein